MMEKVISGSDKSCTVTVSGEVTRVRFEGSYLYIQVRHLSGEIFCGRKPDITDGEDGVSKLTSGGICFDVASPVVYIGGNGVCEVYATNSETLVFKDAPAVSGGGSESGGNGMTLMASVAGVSTTSKTIEGFNFNVGDRYYFEGYYQATISGYSKQSIFTNFIVEIHELSQTVKAPFYVLNSTGTPIHGDKNFVNITFNVNNTMNLWTGEDGLTKLNIYKLD